MPQQIVRPEMGDRTFDVYVPHHDDPLNAVIARGAGIVGRPQFNPDDRRVQIDYEPPGPAVNVVTWADRVFHAASRQDYDYPTSKRVWPERRALIHVASFEPVAGLLVLDDERGDPDARFRLYAWLGLEGSMGVIQPAFEQQLDRTGRGGSVYA